MLDGFHGYQQQEPRIRVHVPMMVSVDYLGYRLLCMPILPIDHSTIIYGSDDGGETIHTKDPYFNRWMQETADALHLAGHRVRGSGERLLYSAGDIEAHRGRDGRYYLIDLARWSPPQCPVAVQHIPRISNPMSAFYNLLRPELLQLWKAWKTPPSKDSPVPPPTPPLSPDALTGWGDVSDESPEAAAEVARLNQDVHRATKFLLEVVVPKFAAGLGKKVSISECVGVWVCGRVVVGMLLLHSFLSLHTFPICRCCVHRIDSGRAGNAEPERRIPSSWNQHPAHGSRVVLSPRNIHCRETSSPPGDGRTDSEESSPGSTPGTAEAEWKFPFRLQFPEALCAVPEFRHE